MAAFSLFRGTNMAVVTSCENQRGPELQSFYCLNNLMKETAGAKDLKSFKIKLFSEFF